MIYSSLLSRRDFLVTTSVGAVGFLSARNESHGDLSAPQVLYVGTYTEGGRRDGVYVLHMDAESGALRKIAEVDAGPNPSFLAIGTGGRSLYTVNEVARIAGLPTGAVRAFAIDAASGGLSLLGEQPSEGAAPCYVSLDRTGKVAMVANYTGGTIALLPINEAGALGRASQTVQHVGTGPDKNRQEKAHAHCILAHPSNKFVLAADLGVDRVLVYRFHADRGTLVHVEESDALMPPGTGPRHLAFHPTLPLVYVAGELNSTVTALRCDPQTSALSIMQSASTIPVTWTAANFPADLHVAPDGRVLYVSNRGHNSIAVYSIDGLTGRLALQEVVATGGDWPRNFALDPTGRWLLAANQRSGSIVVFARDAKTGRLTPTAQRIDVPAPACLCFRA